MTKIYQKIYELAKMQGKSINDVEKELGLPVNSLYGIKRSVPSADKLEVLADYFEVSMDYLLERDEAYWQATKNGGQTIETKLAQMIDHLKKGTAYSKRKEKLSEKNKALVIKLLGVVLQILNE